MLHFRRCLAGPGQHIRIHGDPAHCDSVGYSPAVLASVPRPAELRYWNQEGTSRVIFSWYIMLWESKNKLVDVRMIMPAMVKTHTQVLLC